MTLESLGERRSWVFDQMRDAGAFLPTSDGRYFLDPQAATEFLRRKRTRVLIGSAILLALLLIVWACGVFGR